MASEILQAAPQMDCKAAGKPRVPFAAGGREVDPCAAPLAACAAYFRFASPSD
jgi:hypothetical protein